MTDLLAHSIVNTQTVIAIGDDRPRGARNRYPPSHEKKLHNKHWRAHGLTFVQIELGTACGKLFRCGTMVVLDPGDSDILSQET